MRRAILCLMISSVLVGFVTSEENDEELEAESVDRLMETLDFVGAEDLRSDEECIPRDSECTDDRHGCCRSKLFKDKCKCFYVEGNDTETEEEMCTCQQVWYLGMTENIVDRASNLFHKFFG